MAMFADARLCLVLVTCEPRFDLRDERLGILREFRLTARSAERVFAVWILECESRVARVADADDHVADRIDDLVVGHEFSLRGAGRTCGPEERRSPGPLA